MSHIMRKPVYFAYAKTKVQISRMADQRLHFCYIDITIHLLRLVSNLFGNSEDRFSHDAA